MTCVCDKYVYSMNMTYTYRCITYIAFSNGLIYQYAIDFPQFYLWLNSSLLIVIKWYSILWMNHSIFTHSSINILVVLKFYIMNKTDGNIYVQVFVWTCVAHTWVNTKEHSFWIIWKECLFSEETKLSSKVAVSFCIATRIPIAPHSCYHLLSVF